MTSHFSGIKRFELAVMRPIWLSIIVIGLVHGFRHEWWSVAAMVVALLLFGGIGGALHPVMSASELAEGPTDSTGAKDENSVLSSAVQRAVIARGCNLSATFLIPYVGWIATRVLGWRWYVALPLALATSTLIGGAVRYWFVLRPADAAA
jgi:hypothetical protein